MRAACCEATVLRHEVIADDIRLLTALWPDREHVPHAGQFFTLRAWGADEAPFLSRPISVHKWDAETQTVEFLYAVVGEGTRKLTALKKGDSFQLTGPMGNGFDVADILSKYQKIAVVGGGIGTAPMYQLTRELAAGGVKPDVFFGFRDKPYCMEEYRSIAGIVKVSTDTGAVGYGEAPPTGVITGDTTGAIIGAIRDHIAPAILGRGLDEFEDLTAAVQKALVHNTSAKAAVDMALWDLLGQKYSAPVYRMLGGARSNIVTDITISVNPPEEMARDARTAIQRGYDCLKVKVGIDPELDVARLAAVREAVGKDVKLRIDANQAWNAKQAVRILDQMQEKGLDIEFVEQPVPAADLEGMQYVTRHASVPVLADESVFSPADALRIMQTGAADFVNIKLMKCGGITNALRIASAAEVYGVECMIGCMLEAKISVNAAVELACAKKIITKVDLDGPVLCSEDHILGGAVFDEKNITVSDAPGMGIQGFVPGKVTYLDD